MSPPGAARPAANRVALESEDSFAELSAQKLLDCWDCGGPSPSLSEEAISSRQQDLVSVIELNHQLNALLWEQEDLARRPFASDSEIARNKRRIDWLNQHRSRSVEVIDELIEARLRSVCPRRDARCNSETPGAIIDRLSIASLKIFHMRAESLRADSPSAQRRKCAAALVVLEAQRSDLNACLTTLLQDLACGSARFRSYRHFKMYNDPDLNPHLRSANFRREP